MNNDGIFLTYKDLAKRWQISLVTLSRWRTCKTHPFSHVPYLKFNKGLRYNIQDILTFEKNNTNIL